MKVTRKYNGKVTYHESSSPRERRFHKRHLEAYLAGKPFFYFDREYDDKTGRSYRKVWKVDQEITEVEK